MSEQPVDSSDTVDETPTQRYAVSRGTQCPHHERIFADLVRVERATREERAERTESDEKIWRAHNALATRFAMARPWLSLLAAAGSGVGVALLTRLFGG